jgi:nucleoside-diphosphate-sugar epimerase
VIDNATAENDITQAQLAEAICKAIDVPCKSVAYEDASARAGAFLAGFLTLECRASNRKAREELGWEIKEKGIMEDVEFGSYVEVAKALKNGS